MRLGQIDWDTHAGQTIFGGTRRHAAVHDRRWPDHGRGRDHILPMLLAGCSRDGTPKPALTGSVIPVTIIPAVPAGGGYLLLVRGHLPQADVEPA